jgi:hypothetical protein
LWLVQCGWVCAWLVGVPLLLLPLLLLLLLPGYGCHGGVCAAVSLGWQLCCIVGVSWAAHLAQRRLLICKTCVEVCASCELPAHSSRIRTLSKQM